MKITKEIVLALVAGRLGITVCAGVAHIETVVVDEVSGDPIKDVAVCGSFKMDGNTWEYVKGHPSPNFDEGRTDSQGRCKLRGETNCGKVSCFLESGPTSYYWRHKCGGYSFKSKNLFGVWQPENVVVTVKLQRVERPIPLWVKSVRNGDFKVSREDLFEKGGGRISFDFLEGDWLPPVGRGKIADVEFTRLPREDLGEVVGASGVRGRSYRDCVAVKFVGEDNGIQEMKPSPGQMLRIRMAKESGYLPEYLCWQGDDAELMWKSNYDENRCFCFRIRTQKDNTGKIVKAHYGKIYGDFLLSYKNEPFVPVASVWFQYYLNFTSLDRNLEWDCKTNLCPNPGGVNGAIP